MPVEVAYHSVQMAPLEADFHAALGGLAPRAPELPLYSTAYGTRVQSAVHDAGVLVAQRAPAGAAATGARGRGRRRLHRIPRGGAAPGAGCGDPRGARARRSRGQDVLLLEATRARAARPAQDRGGAARQAASRSSWSALHTREGASPNCPSTRSSASATSSRPTPRAAARLGPVSTTGFFSVDRVGAERALRLRPLAPGARATCGDHKIKGAVVFAAAAYVDAALCASRELHPERAEHVLEDVRFERALVVRKDATPMLMLDLQRSDGSFGVFARHDDQQLGAPRRGSPAGAGATTRACQHSTRPRSSGSSAARSTSTTPTRDCANSGWSMDPSSGGSRACRSGARPERTACWPDCTRTGSKPAAAACIRPCSMRPSTAYWQRSTACRARWSRSRSSACGCSTPRACRRWPTRAGRAARTRAS